MTVGRKRRFADEAEVWVRAEIGRMRALSYSELVSMEGDSLHVEKTSASGDVLILETEVMWDGDPDDVIRVIVDVWNPNGGRWFGIWGSEAKDGFIRASDGSFVDE